jgi:hypothetical protein
MQADTSFTTVVMSPALVRATISRIETFQLAMDEQPITRALLMSQLDGDVDMSSAIDGNRLKSWTRSEALRKTVAETNAIMDVLSRLSATEGQVIGGDCDICLGLQCGTAIGSTHVVIGLRLIGRLIVCTRELGRIVVFYARLSGHAADSAQIARSAQS